jgi:small subunit ribosomal protein S9
MAEDSTETPTLTDASASTEVQPTPELPKRAKPDRGGFYWGTGRRKTAVARVRIRPGDGKITINKRSVEEYFTELQDRIGVIAPLTATKTESNLDVFVNLKGGGPTGQAGAMLLGISRALKGYDPALEPILRENNFLTRDAREVERKKYGQRGARRRFQFSKR